MLRYLEIGYGFRGDLFMLGLLILILVKPVLLGTDIIY